MRWSALLISLIAAVPSTGAASPSEVAAADYRRAIPGEPVDVAPWTVLADPTLSGLVDEALGANGDLAAAVRRIEQADALAAQALAPALPFLSGAVGANVGPGETLGPVIPGFEPPDVIWTGSALVLAKWNIDLFGQRILAQQAGLSDKRASRHDRDQFAVSLGVQVTEAWLDAAAAQRQVEVLEGQLRLGRELLQGMERRFEQGVGSAAAVLQQRRQVQALTAAGSPARTQLEIARERLNILLARQPGGRLVDAPTLPQLPAAPPTGRPSDLLSARPDLRSAAARQTATGQRRMSAGRAFFPTLGINAQGGIQWRAADGEFDDLGTWGVGVSLNVPFFSGGGSIAGARAARAAELASVRSTEQLILAAVGEVESGLARRAELVAQLEATTAQLAAARAAFDIARDRYAAGLDDYLTLLTSWNSLLQDELTEVQVRRSLLGADVRLRASLGGAWTRAVRGAED